MNFIVCMKRVPDSEARIEIDSDGRSIDPAGIKFVMNPFDEYALEQALLLREQAGEGRVTALTLGADSSNGFMTNFMPAVSMDRPSEFIFMRASESGTRFMHTMEFTALSSFG